MGIALENMTDDVDSDVDVQIDVDVDVDADLFDGEAEQWALAQKNAVAIWRDDHIKTGRNIYIGDGPSHLLLPMLETLDVHLYEHPVLDFAFVTTRQLNARLLRNVPLPADHLHRLLQRLEGRCVQWWPFLCGCYYR